jgi:DNA adenine methylase
MYQRPLTGFNNTVESDSAARPFLKWAGGKQMLLPQLLPHLPKANRLIDPFVGAGSVWLASAYSQYLINDANPDLVSVWTALKQRPKLFMELSAQLFTEEYFSANAYQRVRSDFNNSSDRFERAVRFIYLNRLGFNGLYRVNKSGQYNVPYGYPKKLPAFPTESLERAASKLTNCEVMGGGYGPVIDRARKGDLVYCDPPYLSDTGKNSTVAYTDQGFGAKEFSELVGHCESAKDRGAKVVISQVDTALARELLRGWCIFPVSVRTNIAGAVSARGFRRELIAISH